MAPRDVGAAASRHSGAPTSQPGPALTRREWLRSLPAVALAPGAVGVLGEHAARVRRDQPEPVRLRGIHSVTLAVRDVARSVEFYQGLFGCPVQARQGSNVLLRVAEGPRFLALEEAREGPPRISRFGLAVVDFDPERVVRALESNGVTRAPAPGDSPGPMQVAVRDRDGTPEVLLADPHGMSVQLQAPADCGGGGPLGSVCAAAEPAAAPGSLRLTGISHLTNNAGDPERSVSFYRQVFGLEIQAYQAAAPLLGVGTGGREFLMFIGGTVGRSEEEALRRPGAVHHACLSVTEFSVAGVRAALEENGVQARDGAGPGPLRHWISLRMPDRGGAPGGTPELYFSDPDGLSIQLQDTSYCGGGGYLGDDCG